MKHCFLLASIILLLSNATAQDKNSLAGFGVEANYSIGNGVVHTSKMRAGFPYTINSGILNFVQQTNGHKDWQQRRHYPLIGWAIMYTDYDRNHVYGHAVCVFPNLQIPLIGGKKVECTLTAGFGVGYLSKRYGLYPDFDTLNTAIGSHMNNCSYFATDIRYHLNKHVDLQMGMDFAHMSNAAFRQPNLGINKYGAHIGVRYFPVTSQPERIHTELPKLKNRIYIEGKFGMAAVEQSTPNGPMYPVYLGSLLASRRYAGKNKMFIGVDYSFYNNVYRFLLNNEIFPGHEKEHSWKSAVFIGNEFLIGRVGIMFQLGYYLKKNALSDYIIYEKLGGNVYIVQREKGVIKEFFPYVYLKTHSTQAELVEAGLGIGF